MNPAAIILAAGASRRLGQPKQLVARDGEALVARAARLALEAGCVPVLVVLGCRAAEIRPALEPLPVQVLVNEGWEEGMASSIRAGLAALPGTVQGVLLMVCDQVRLEAGHLHALVAAWARDPARPAASGYGDGAGVPAVFPRRLFRDLIGLRGDRGARGLLGARAREVQLVPFAEGIEDLDAPEQLRDLAP